ncbi:MAG TPA: penicillin-binding transpeptidase domain-containing protein [Spirochaetota bacterium]|nr:penicillin-binding transpeptidase domain-containing protein [Spirochaetota bacterium]HPG49064.1 penicillin-binding transpeptidase domain-containing protein [Spirochaetota bacterium]HPN11879.1 penicillin-binding transpeptidase domain-containing protein [Spirochaetota bacterium]
MNSPCDENRVSVRFAVLFFYLAVSVLAVQPVETRDEQYHRAFDIPVSIDILSKQVRLLREGTLKDITVTIDDSTEIRDTLHNERIMAHTLTFTNDGVIRIMADSREAARPVRIILNGASKDASCNVRVGGEVRRYPLPMTIVYDKNGLRFLVMEELYRYILDSASAEYGMEYIKDQEAVMALAHVIAARYRFKQEARVHDGADFCDLTHCQVYRGRIARITVSDEWMIDHAALPVNMFFHSRCGGNTLDERVFSNHGSKRVTGNEGVKDYLFQDGTWLCRSADSTWERSISREELLKLILPDARHRADEPISIQYDRKRLELRISEGNKTISIPPETFRLAINRVKGWNYIKSNNFTIKETIVDEKHLINFRGEGLGHCVGFCQHGALALARRGYNRFEILEHYYPTLTLKPVGGNPVTTPFLSYCVFDLSTGAVREICPGQDFIHRRIPAGSVFKLIVALYLVSERPDIVNEYTFNCCGTNTHDMAMPDRCWNQHGHGALQLKDAIPYSCNLYFASLYNRISIKKFSDFFNAFCLCAGIQAGLPRISGDREWSLMLAGLDFRLTFAIDDYIKLVRFLNCSGSYATVEEACPAVLSYDQRLAIFRALKETCIKGTAGGVTKPYGAECNYQALPEHVKNETWDMSENAWGKTATVIDGTNLPVSYGMFIGGSGRTGVVVVLRKGNGHLAARWARAVLSHYTGH